MHLRTSTNNKHAPCSFPPSPPYWKGRFSNGPTWLEYVAEKIDYKVVNFGHGGATTDNAHAYSEFNGYVVPGVLQQVENLPVDGAEDDLYIIYIGYNDLNGIVNPDQYKIVKEGYTVDDM